MFLRLFAVSCEFHLGLRGKHATSEKRSYFQLQKNRSDFTHLHGPMVVLWPCRHYGRHNIWLVVVDQALSSWVFSSADLAVDRGYYYIPYESQACSYSSISSTALLRGSVLSSLD